MTLVMLEGDLAEIERYVFDSDKYNVGARNYLFTLKEDHPSLITCYFCVMMGAETKDWFEHLDRVERSARLRVNQPIYIDGKEI